MALDTKIVGTSSGNGAEVDSSNNVKVVTPAVGATGRALAGYVVPALASHDGTSGLAKLLRDPDISFDFRQRVGVDGLWFQDTFNYAAQNSSVWSSTVTTMTATYSGGFLILNGGSSVASGAVARQATYKHFPMFTTAPLYLEVDAVITQNPQTSNVLELGLFQASGTTAPTDGVLFRFNGGAAFLGVVNYNGAETTVDLGTFPSVNERHSYLICVEAGRVEFWLDQQLVGAITTPVGQNAPCISPAQPITFRNYNSAATSLAQQLKIGGVSLTVADVPQNRLWPTTCSGMGMSGIQGQNGYTQGQTANYANSAAPASATLSNTAAGYTTLGGQFQFAAVAGAETDYALFAYQVPAATVAIPGRTLVIRGIWIDTFNTVVAVATTATVLQWALGVGATAVSLATAEAATARAPRRIALGTQSFPVGAAVGAQADRRIDVNLDAPVTVEAGSFVHIILKMPIATATATEIFRGVVGINAYFE